MIKLHPTSVTETSGEELGRQIGALRYDKLVEVITGIKKEILRQQIGDAVRGYTELSTVLGEMHQSLSSTQYWCKESVDICKKYIEAEKTENERNQPA